jgi:hypothetical protein
LTLDPVKPHAPREHTRIQHSLSPFVAHVKLVVTNALVLGPHVRSVNWEHIFKTRAATPRARRTIME